MFRFCRLVILAFAFLGYAAPPVVAAEDPVAIPVILSLTGPGAFLGNSTRRTIVALEAHANAIGGIQGHPVRFTFYDDQTNPQVAVQLTNAVKAQTPVILGYNLAGTCKAIMPMSVPPGPVAYCFAPTVTPVKDSYVFSASVSSRDLQAATLRYFRNHGWKRFALLATTEASGQDAVDELSEVLKLPENKDMMLVASERFNPSDVSVTAQVSRIKSASPQALIAWAPGTPFATALHAMNDLGLDIPITASGANMISAQLEQLASFAPKDLTFAGFAYAGRLAPNARVKKQQDEYFSVLREATIEPDLLSGVAWDPVQIVLSAFRSIGPKATAAQIHSFIENLHGYSGIIGTYDFRDGSQRGMTSDGVVMIRWRAHEGYSNVTKLGAR